MESIQSFLSQPKIAVAGVSRKKQKFGNAIFKELEKRGFEVLPVNPNIDDYQGHRCYHRVTELPEDVTALVINTRNETSLELLREAQEKGLKHVWLQQGSLSKESLKALEDGNGMNIISRECILMHAGRVSGVHAFHRWINKTFGSYPS